jgi:hypothetical protein
MTTQLAASHTIIILTTLEVSIMLLENINITGITHDDHHLKKLCKAGKDYQGKPSSLLRSFINHECKKFYDIEPQVPSTMLL